MDAELAKKIDGLEARIDRLIDIVNSCRVEYRDDNKMKAMIGFPFMGLMLLLSFAMLRAHGML